MARTHDRTPPPERIAELARLKRRLMAPQWQARLRALRDDDRPQQPAPAAATGEAPPVAAEEPSP
jgi:hypothetical protein